MRDRDLLQNLQINIRWNLSLRGDGAFSEEALPLTGRLPKPRLNPYGPQEFYSFSEEKKLLSQGCSSLLDRVAWLWLKSLTGEAIKIRTATVAIPETGDATFQEQVNHLRPLLSG